MADTIPKLRPYQTEPLRAIVDSVLHRRGLTFSVMMSRQAGKNELSAQLEVLLLTLHWARGGNLVKASPTFKPQTINSMLRLKERLDGAGYGGYYHSEFGYQVVFGRARALFYSAEPTANVVGATAHILLEIDEAQDVDLDKYQKDFRPMGATTNVTTVHYGTAWTDDSLLERVKQQNLEQERRDGRRRHFEYNWETVAQHNDDYRRYVEAERARLGPDHPLFTTQYELRTLTAGGRLLSPTQLAQLQGDHPRQPRPTSGRVYVAGLDLAGEDEEMEDQALRAARPRRDSTVLTVGEVAPQGDKGEVLPGQPSVRIVDILWRTGVRHADLYAQLVDLLRSVWRCAVVVVDASGVGAGVASFLAQALGSRVHPIAFTAPIKSALGWGLLDAINGGRLKMWGPPATVHAACTGDGETIRATAQGGGGRTTSATASAGPEAAEFWQEMRRARSALRANQTMTFYVDPAEGHDDFVVAAALLVEAALLYQPRTAHGR